MDKNKGEDKYEQNWVTAANDATGLQLLINPNFKKELDNVDLTL